MFKFVLKVVSLKEFARREIVVLWLVLLFQSKKRFGKHDLF